MYMHVHYPYITSYMYSQLAPNFHEFHKKIIHENIIVNMWFLYRQLMHVTSSWKLKLIQKSKNLVPRKFWTTRYILQDT